MTTVRSSSVGESGLEAGGRDSQRVPPHSIDAEVCVLGSMMLHAPVIDVLCQTLRPEDFYRPAHRTVYEVLLGMRDRNKPIDLVSVPEELTRLKLIEEVGGVDYLVSLVEGVPNAANAEYYARIVRDKALLRGLISAGTDIVREAYSTTEEASEFLDRSEQRIFDVASRQVGDEAVDLQGILRKTFERLQEQEGELITGVASGYPQLDEYTSGFQKGEMIIVAARPSMGKTSLLMNFAEHMAVLDKVPTVIFSMEMSKEQLAQRFLAAKASFNLKQMRRGMISAEDWTKLQLAAGDLEQAPIFIDDSPVMTALQIRAKARRLVHGHGIKCVLVDYLQLITYFGSARSRQEQMTEISRAIKALARELNIPVICAAQLNRGPADRETHRPRMSDLRESGSIEQDADVVMLLHNEDYYHRGQKDYIPKNKTELIIAKQRNGPTGIAYFTFFPAFTRFESAAPDDYDSVPI